MSQTAFEPSSFLFLTFCHRYEFARHFQRQTKGTNFTDDDSFNEIKNFFLLE